MARPRSPETYVRLTLVLKVPTVRRKQTWIHVEAFSQVGAPLLNVIAEKLGLRHFEDHPLEPVLPISEPGVKGCV